jgi:AraC-like DNA-binding protein
MCSPNGLDREIAWHPRRHARGELMGANELAFVGLAGSGLGTALGVPMVWPWSRHSADARLLGAAVLLMAAIGALISARLAGFVAPSAPVEHAINVLGLCAFPLLVLYTRHVKDLPVTAATAASCVLPAVIYVAVVAVRVSLGGENRVPFIWMLPAILGFTAASAATVWRRDGSRRSALVPAEWVLAFVVALNVAQIVRMEFGHVPVVRAIVPIVLSTGFLAVAALLASRAVMPSPPAAPAGAAAPRYERSGLDESTAPDLLRRIDAALTHDRLFARPDLTLGQLAAAAGCTPHQVSEALNRYGGVSFHDLLIRRRLEDVKAQLVDPASERFTIEGIGASAGFGSRSALYAAFRRFEGMTPSAYRAARRGGS